MNSDSTSVVAAWWSRSPPAVSSPASTPLRSRVRAELERARLFLHLGQALLTEMPWPAPSVLHELEPAEEGQS